MRILRWISNPGAGGAGLTASGRDDQRLRGTHQTGLGQQTRYQSTNSPAVRTTGNFLPMELRHHDHWNQRQQHDIDAAEIDGTSVEWRPARGLQAPFAKSWWSPLLAGSLPRCSNRTLVLSDPITH